jgi:spore coat protein U-like protein
MTRTRLIVSAAAVALAGAALLAPVSLTAAQNTGTLTVTASVTAYCTVTNTTLVFSAYDPIVTNATAALDQTVNVTVTCTKGASTVWLGAGNGGNYSSGRRMKSGTTDFLNYELYTDPARTKVWDNAGSSTGITVPTTGGKTTPASVTVYGRVPGAQDVPVGSYTDSVLMTVNF